MNYNESLDYIFETYMKKKGEIKGKSYQEYKDPSIIGNIIRDHDLLPRSSRVITVTGSKGKGTTARTMAHMLKKITGRKVALFTSPEEFEHVDRISINGEYISEESFSSTLMQWLPYLEVSKSKFKGLDYFSPYGLFLLIALSWFKKEGADYFIIECGRGVRFDDSNVLSSEIGVITSIFKEHLDYFGPSELDVFNDKIFLANRCERLIVPRDLCRFDLPDNSYVVDDYDDVALDIPNVYKKSFNLAKQVVMNFIQEKNHFDESDFKSSSFAKIEKEQYSIVYDCIIDTSGFDEEWVSRHREYFFFISLPDDKNLDEIILCMKKFNLKFILVALEGTRGYLDYKNTLESGCKSISLNYSEPQLLDFYIMESKSKKNAFWGTQSFIRFVKEGIL